MPTKISIFIIARNEGDRIARTLRSLTGLSDDVILVDSGSTDDTVSIATSMGVRVVHNDWPGYGKQKRFAEDLCRHDWVFNLDADEVLSESLQEEISALLSSSTPLGPAYRVRIVDVIPGDDKPRIFAHHHNYVRLYDRKFSSFSPSSVHDTVDVGPGVVCEQLKGSMYHFSIRNIASQIEKFNIYTDSQVDDLLRNNASIPVFRLFIEFPISFFKAFIFRRYFLQGLHGFFNAMNYAIFRYLRVAKFIEARQAMKRTGRGRGHGS